MDDKQDRPSQADTAARACLLDASGTLLAATDSFLALLGYAREELVGQNAAKWDTASSVLRNEGSAAAGPLGISSPETCLRRKDGSSLKAGISVSRIEAGNTPVLLVSVHLTANSDRPKDSVRRVEADFDRFLGRNSSVMMLIEPADGIIVAANEAASAFYGYPPEQLVGMPITAINLLPAEEVARQRASALHMERSFFTFPHRVASGQVRNVEVHSSPFAVDGQVLLFSIVRDVTEHRAAQRALQLSEKRYRTIFQTSLDAIDIRRLGDGTYFEVNQSFVEIMGYTPEEVIGRTSVEMGIWVDLADRQRLVDAMRANLVCRNLEAKFRKKNGTEFWGLISSSVFEVDGVEFVLTITRDISEAKKAEEEIRSLAFYDPLTGLVNRHLLRDRLLKVATASARSRREHALLFIDLDNFKPLNDTLGHQFGDLLLKEVARRLSACVRKSDTVARLGGDEFIILLENLGEYPEAAETRARCVGEKILASARKTYVLEGHSWRCSASIGIVLFGKQFVSSDEVLQRADEMMYRAKAAGRNGIRIARLRTPETL